MDAAEQPRNPTPWLTVARIGVALLLAAGALLSIADPALLAERFRIPHGRHLDSFRRAAILVSEVAWAPLLGACGILLLGGRGRSRGGRRRLFTSALLALALLAYLGGTRPLADWIVDDSGITFAYSRNLAEGYGLVAHPGYPPQEGYSNTSWMLILAAAHRLGFDIPAAAKAMDLALGATALALSLLASLRRLEEHAQPATLLLVLSVALGAPFLVWTTSGLEDGLQALLLMLVVAAPLVRPRPEAVMGLSFAGLVLTRPEAPLLLGCVAATTFARLWRTGETRKVSRMALLLVPGGVAALALLGFRLAYFGDPLPNPYYAKADDASFLRLLNLLGGGWRYLFSWASSSGALVLIPLLAATIRTRVPMSVATAIGLLVGQAAFAISVGGDWMNEYRFVAPALPVLAYVVAHSCRELSVRIGTVRQSAVAGASAAVLGLFATFSLVRFVALPTTPLATVAEIGGEFTRLAERLGIRHMTLAHHDAGGTLYSAGIELIDLGGLIDRRVALHMNDRAFMVKYLLEEKRPSFIFGSRNSFAAGKTRFYLDPRFERDYVPVLFPGKPIMRAGLCHIRRDLVREVPGVSVVRKGGKIVSVVVED